MLFKNVADDGGDHYASVVVWISMRLGLFQYKGYASQLVSIREFTCFKGNVGQRA